MLIIITTMIKNMEYYKKAGGITKQTKQ